MPRFLERDEALPKALVRGPMGWRGRGPALQAPWRKTLLKEFIKS